jgi:hypothetical protein
MVAMCWLDQGIQGVYVQLLPSPQVPAFEATPSPVEADAWHQLDFLLPAAKLGTAAAAVLLGSLTARRIGRALALTPVPLIFTLAVTALTAAAVPDSGWEELLGSDWTVAGSLIGFAASWALLPITRRPVSGRRP